MLMPEPKEWCRCPLGHMTCPGGAEGQTLVLVLGSLAVMSLQWLSPLHLPLFRPPVRLNYPYWGLSHVTHLALTLSPTSPLPPEAHWISLTLGCSKMSRGGFCCCFVVASSFSLDSWYPPIRGGFCCLFVLFYVSCWVEKSWLKKVGDLHVCISQPFKKKSKTGCYPVGAQFRNGPRVLLG